MLRWMCMAGLVSLVACQGKGDEDGSGEDSGSASASGDAPEDCRASTDVCAAYSSAWSGDDAAAHCDSLGGERGACPDGELGRCTLDDGLIYHLYDMPPLEAKGYCEWLLGEWTTDE